MKSLFTRTRNQDGSLSVKDRESGEKVWEFRYYDTDERGQRVRRTATVGPLSQYPSESAARRSPILQAILLRVNADQPCSAATVPSFGAVLARYEQEEMPPRYSTSSAYKSHIKNHIRPRWEDTPLNMVKPMAVEHWLKELELAPKTKSNIRGLMHTIFECARRWELADKNPMALVRVKGGSKRLKRPLVITVEQFWALLPLVKKRYRTAVFVAQCLGLRASEIMALKWGDFDFEDSKVYVQQGIVHGHLDDVKTEYSQDYLPLHPKLVDALLKHKEVCCPTAEGWLFANPDTGRPYHQDGIQKDHIRPAGIAAGIGDRVGWHTFRHTYRALMGDSDIPLSVQKELMRHASIQTTMNVYGNAMDDSKRAANAKVIRMILRVPGGEESERKAG